ncbi:hypothetical protein [Dialister succinatiphilus]|uniref:hypothetical protein n=1 Tax=Dialister succinatiphilus TaxID=487173 RepID=UPI003F7CDD29
MKKLTKLLMAACFIMSCSVTAQAQGSDLDEVIVNADRYKNSLTEDQTYAGGYLSGKTSLGLQKDKDMMEVPASTMTITDKAIKDFAISGNNEIMDILSLNPSVRRTTSPNVVSVRGKYTTASQMNVNNIPGMYSNFTMGTNFIGNIDVLGGPSLVYSGSTTQNVIGGTINYQSKRAGMAPLNDVRIKYTGDSNFQESVDVGRRFGKDNEWGVRINALTGDGKLAVHGEKLKNRNIFVNLDHYNSESSTNLLLGYARSVHYGGNSIFQTVSSSATNYRKLMPYLPSAPDGKHNLNPSWAYQESRTWLMTLNHEQKINDHWAAYLNAGIMRGEKSLAGNILESMGGELLVPDSREISKEQLIELNPDALFVVVIEGNYDKADQVLSYFYNERAFDSVDCVKNHRISVLPLYSIYSAGVRMSDGIDYIGKGLYPDLFQDTRSFT